MILGQRGGTTDYELREIRQLTFLLESSEQLYEVERVDPLLVLGLLQNKGPISFDVLALISIEANYRVRCPGRRELCSCSYA